LCGGVDGDRVCGEVAEVLLKVQADHVDNRCGDAKIHAAERKGCQEIADDLDQGSYGVDGVRGRDDGHARI
jgi:hypothetical protein